MPKICLALAALPLITAFVLFAAALALAAYGLCRGLKKFLSPVIYRLKYRR